jgi:hypothetical protein
MKKNEQIEEIKKHIKKLHAKNSGDYESLIRQVSKFYKPVQYNLPQMLLAHAARVRKNIYAELGRGTGKSTDLGRQMKDVVTEMPRSSNLLIGDTYKNILTRTIPSTILGLERHGYFEGLHYFIRTQPPPKWRKTWPKPYQPPKDFDKFIIFFTGAGYHLISQDVPGDGRGLNTDSECIDECGTINKEKLDTNTSPTIRGSNNRAFNGNPFYKSSYRVGSTPLTLEGRWFVEMEEVTIKNPDKFYFLSANAKWNEHNLAPNWLEEQKLTTLPWIYNAEYLNIRPKHTEGMFYFLLNEEVHGYSNFNYSYINAVGQDIDCRGDADLNLHEPLLLGADWGSAINSCVITQRLGMEFRVLKNMYVLSINQENQNDLYDKLDRYYSHKKAFNNLIYLYYDNTGNIDTGFTKLTRAQTVKKQLNDKGWKVILVTSGNTNPRHESKFRLYEIVLKGGRSTLPIFRINKHNCKELIIAMQNAKTSERSDRVGIKKDKTSERVKGESRVYATDLTDALDSVFFQNYSYLLSSSGLLLPPTSIK